jgi:hypothetical protein
MWDLSSNERGIVVEKALGSNLAPGFKTIEIGSSEAVGIESIDLTRPT